MFSLQFVLLVVFLVVLTLVIIGLADATFRLLRRGRRAADDALQYPHGLVDSGPPSENEDPFAVDLARIYKASRRRDREDVLRQARRAVENVTDAAKHLVS